MAVSNCKTFVEALSRGSTVFEFLSKSRRNEGQHIRSQFKHKCVVRPLSTYLSLLSTTGNAKHLHDWQWQCPVVLPELSLQSCQVDPQVVGVEEPSRNIYAEVN